MFLYKVLLGYRGKEPLLQWMLYPERRHDVWRHKEASVPALWPAVRTVLHLVYVYLAVYSSPAFALHVPLFNNYIIRTPIIFILYTHTSILLFIDINDLLPLQNNSSYIVSFACIEGILWM